MILGRRILINTYRINDFERAGFLNLARSAQKDQPHFENFGFQVYAHPEEHDFFAEIILLPDPAVAGTKTAMEAYHFASSYQPERDSCIKIGSRLISFRGTYDDDAGPVPLDSAAIRYTPIQVEEEGKESLLSSVDYLAKNRQHQSQILCLSSTEFPGNLGLLEFFSTVGDFQLSEESGDTDPDMGSARKNIEDAALQRYDLPTTFVRFR